VAYKPALDATSSAVAVAQQQSNGHLPALLPAPAVLIDYGPLMMAGSVARYAVATPEEQKELVQEDYVMLKAFIAYQDARGSKGETVAHDVYVAEANRFLGQLQKIKLPADVPTQQ
jgi:hypothetical protein